MRYIAPFDTDSTKKGHIKKKNTHTTEHYFFLKSLLMYWCKLNIHRVYHCRAKSITMSDAQQGRPTITMSSCHHNANLLLIPLWNVSTMLQNLENIIVQILSWPYLVSDITQDTSQRDSGGWTGQIWPVFLPVYRTNLNLKLMPSLGNFDSKMFLQEKHKWEARTPSELPEIV